MRKSLVVAACFLAAAAARAEVKVMDTKDVVRLVSGEEVTGTVLASGLRAVVIVVEREETVVERTIPREQVESITRGEFSPTFKDYVTETVEGIKVVTGVGTGETGETGEEPGGPEPPPGRVKPGGPKPVPPIDRNQLKQLMQKDKNLERIVNGIGGPDKAIKWLEKNRSNPTVSKFLEQLLKTGKLPPGLLRGLFKK